MTRIPASSAAGTDTWSREAAHVQILAAQAGQHLDDEELLLLDVYEVRALRSNLEHAAAKEPGRQATQRQPVLGWALLGTMTGGR